MSFSRTENRVNWLAIKTEKGYFAFDNGFTINGFTEVLDEDVRLFLPGKNSKQLIKSFLARPHLAKKMQGLTYSIIKVRREYNFATKETIYTIKGELK